MKSLLLLLHLPTASLLSSTCRQDTSQAATAASVSSLQQKPSHSSNFSGIVSMVFYNLSVKLYEMHMKYVSNGNTSTHTYTAYQLVTERYIEAICVGWYSRICALSHVFSTIGGILLKFIVSAHERMEMPRMVQSVALHCKRLHIGFGPSEFPN